MLQSRVEQLDLLIAEFIELNPFQQTVEVITSIMDNKPVIRRDKGRDFVEFTIESLASDYARNRIGHSRYENGKSGMNIFREFLRSTKRGTYRPDSIYVGEITPDLLESYIEWRRDVKQNSDPTINHAHTPILKACDTQRTWATLTRTSTPAFRICVLSQKCLCLMKKPSLTGRV